MKKHCNKCNQEKELTAFGRDIHAKDGFSRSCLVCTKAYRDAYKRKNFGKPASELNIGKRWIESKFVINPKKNYGE